MTRSIPADELVEWLTSLFDNTDSDVQVDANVESENTVTLTLSDYYDDESEARIRQLESEIESKGWYVTSDGGLAVGQDPAEMWFHKITNQEVDVPRYVYHVTPAEKLTKIMTTGLRPARGGARHGFKYPPRVFVSRHPDNLSGMDLGFRQGLEVVILRIDTSAVANLALYADPQFPADENEWMSAYTENTIPPEAISIEKRLKVESLTLLRALIYEMLSIRRGSICTTPNIW